MAHCSLPARSAEQEGAHWELDCRGHDEPLIQLAPRALSRLSRGLRAHGVAAPHVPLPPSLPGDHPSRALASQDRARGTPAPRAPAPASATLAEADHLPPGSRRVPCRLQTAGLASHARPSFPRPQPHLFLSPGSLPPAHKRPNISDGHAPCRRDLVSPFNCVFMKNTFEHRLAWCPLCLSLSPGLP